MILFVVVLEAIQFQWKLLLTETVFCWKVVSDRVAIEDNRESYHLSHVQHRHQIYLCKKNCNFICLLYELNYIADGKCFTDSYEKCGFIPAKPRVILALPQNFCSNWIFYFTVTARAHGTHAQVMQYQLNFSIVCKFYIEIESWVSSVWCIFNANEIV